MRARVTLPGLVLAGLVACGGDTAGRPEEQHQRPGTGKGSAATDAAAPASHELALSRATATPAEPRRQFPTPIPTDRMIIRTGNASLEIDSLETGIAALRALAVRVGGYVANTSIQGGRDQVRHAALEVKVPADRFDELTAGLEPIGRLEFVNVSAQDVGEEFVDLSARAANSRRLEERLIGLLATRTGKLQDVLSVERELARVREEIERIEGRLRYLEARSAVSTLSVALHEPPPLVGEHPGRNLLAEALRQAWRNFVGLLAVTIAALGYVVPVAAALWATIFLGRRVRRLPA